MIKISKLFLAFCGVGFVSFCCNGEETRTQPVSAEAIFDQAKCVEPQSTQKTFRLEGELWEKEWHKKYYPIFYQSTMYEAAKQFVAAIKSETHRDKISYLLQKFFLTTHSHPNDTFSNPELSSTTPTATLLHLVVQDIQSNKEDNYNLWTLLYQLLGAGADPNKARVIEFKQKGNESFALTVGTVTELNNRKWNECKSGKHSEDYCKRTKQIRQTFKHYKNINK